jgi:predicted Fe-S protein YdhL (DUF1289 family)
MAQAAPYEFRDAEEIIDWLSKKKSEISHWFDQREQSLDEVIQESVQSNKFRAFHNLPQKPSVVFREWASQECKNGKALEELEGVRSQLGFDAWSKEFSDKLGRAWKDQMEQSIPYGPMRKLPDLLVKRLMRWSGMDDDRRTEVLSYVHVPLDRYTLVGIRNCIDDPEIPSTATMTFVTGLMMYNQIQSAIRNITERAGVPAIYFDVLAWDMSHGTS